MPIKNRQNGFALIEVLVASVIIAIGVSGLGILLMRVIQSTQDSAQQSQAMWMVQDYVGRIKSNAQGARLGQYELGITPITFCDDLPAQVCAEYYTNGDEVAAQNCDAIQMATFDKFITVCGISPDVFDDASDFVLNPTLLSKCSTKITRMSTGAAVEDCIKYDITLSWDTRITKTSKEADERIQKNSFSTVVELN
jgi:type IV pilus modification protein PilV